MAGTEVTTGRLTEVAKNLEDVIAKYTQSVGKMYDIGGEIDAMWDGDASDKFKATFDSDRPRFEALTEMLRKYVETLNADAAEYNKAESDVLNVLSQNKIR
jgi:WXG100 family type VII secretion target